ncbi:MAG TPA: hypothetical protein VNT53_02535 [Pseudolysinimonas sp.]|nr:hypothetical protein [Pseudolysinimonas sp.]
MTSEPAGSVGGAARFGRVMNWMRVARVGPLRGGGVWGTLGVILAFLAVSIPQWGQPYVIDEAVFPYVADGILKSGSPYFYNGEFRPHDLGLWHPPLYDYLLAAHLGVWGFSPFAVRSFGAICVIAALFFLMLALRKIAPTMRQAGYVALAGLVLLNPLVLSDALVPDIDGTLGPLVVALALWLATIVSQGVLGRRLILGLVAFAVLAVSTKFMIAGIVAAIVLASALISPLQRWTKALWVVIAFAVGTVVSLGLLFALGAALKFDALDPFEYLLGSLGSRAPGRTGIRGTLANLAVGPGSNLAWIGPAVAIAALAVAVAVVVGKPTAVQRHLVILVAASSAAIVLGYSYITASPFVFPKYTAIAVPGFALVTVLVMTLPGFGFPVQGARRASRKLIYIAYIVVLAVGTAGIFAIAARTARLQARSTEELLELSAACFVCVIIATGLCAFALAGEGRWSIPTRQQTRRFAVLGVAFAILLTPLMVQASTSLVNATSPFSTRYYYRERGMATFLEQSRQIVPPRTEIIAPKDVGLQLNRPYFEDALLLSLAPDKLRAKLDKYQAPFLVTRSLYDYSETVFPAQFDVLREYYRPVLASSDVDFTLWELKARS